MGVLDERVYFPDCRHNELSDEKYFNKDKTFGRFIENGSAYVIEKRDTPRPWLQFLCNDKVESCVSNTGTGFLKHISGENITKYWEKKGNYLVRNPNGERKLFVSVDGREPKNFFSDSEDFTATVRPGSVTFKGVIENINIEVFIFVPNKIPCECWNVKASSSRATVIKLTAEQDWGFFVSGVEKAPVSVETIIEKNVIKTVGHRIDGIFAANETDCVDTEKYTEILSNEVEGAFTRVSLTKTFNLKSYGNTEWYIVSGACDENGEYESVLTCLDAKKNALEYTEVFKMWKKLIENIYCELPDKNIEYFINYWLKNNVYLTYRYDRASRLIGYRDGLQDSWGYCLVEPKKAKEKMIITLSHMMTDGRCPRGFSRFGYKNNLDDFSDSPTWAPETLRAYIRETGDFGILDEVIPFFESNEMSTVENHIYRSLDYLYHSRGKNGLIKMRKGDWLDDLSGINKYGEDATSAWVTVAAFHAQNIMAELYDKVGNAEKAELMRTRSGEYKEIFNEVAWDGNWFVYAFFEDGEPIGGAQNLEGKIYLNVQTWAIFTGIVDDEERIKRIKKSIYRYLQTPYGPLLNYPPYVLYGDRCGRLWRQFPGTFANSAVYNHGAGFKIYSDIKLGDYEEALDTLQRALPNHPDNSDMCRTSEPYSVGNVYYGPNHRRFGMNLFSWFTATPSWLIHAAIEQILGVTADYDGLRLEPHVIPEWNGYSVNKLFRGTMYRVIFEKSTTEKGIWIDGAKITGNIVKSNKKECTVKVKY